MRARVAVTVVVLLFVMAFARSSNAQTTWSDHARISINAGIQPSASTFSATTNNPVSDQTSTLTTSYNVPSGQFFDGGVIIRASGGFGIGIGASSFTRSQTAPI